MEITWSKEAKEVIVEMNPWQVIANVMGGFEAHVRLRRPWKLPPDLLSNHGWLNPVLSEPLAIAPIIERLRRQHLLLEHATERESEDATKVNMKQALDEISAKKLEPLAQLTDFAAHLWDYMARIETAKPWENPAYDPSTYVYGPFLPKPVGMYQVAEPDGLTVIDPMSSLSAIFAKYLWAVDSPLHEMKQLEPDAKDIPVPQSGTLGQVVVAAARNQRAADLVRLYRLQATLVDLPITWDWIVRIGVLAKKHGLALADEIDAMAELVNELLSYRHPLVYYAGEAFRNMSADTPDGPAKAFAATTGMMRLLMQKPEAGWSTLMPLLRSVSEASPLAATPPPKKRAERTDVFALITKFRPVLEQRAESMRNLAAGMWKTRPTVPPITLWFNKPPLGVTDGINASVTAHEVLVGVRQMTPITSIGLRFDIARELWKWNEYALVPIEREEAPGEYIAPSDGMPRDILPHALYMGEAGAITQPSKSLVTRLKQFGMIGNVKALSSQFGAWPDRPGSYGYDEVKAKATTITTTKEPEGVYIQGSIEDISNSLTLVIPESLELAIESGRYFVRPEGFASRTVVRTTHPTEYLYMFNESINIKPMDRLWYADWPVNPQDLTLSRPFTSAVTAIIHACYPGLAVEG